MRRALPVALAVLLAVAAFNHRVSSALGPGPLPPMEPLKEIGSLSAGACGGCHFEIKQEWEATGHAKGVTSPLFVKDFENEGRPYFCLECHAPLAEQQPRETLALALAWPAFIPLQKSNERFDEALHHEGVTCVACHQHEGAMRGPWEAPGAPHPVRVSDELSTEKVCERCHTLALTAVGGFQRPLMETVTEWREYREKGGDRFCADCHLPKLTEPRSAAPGAPRRPGRSHRLRGPADEAFLATAIEVRAVRRTGEGVEVTFFNATGHRFPTAEPRRRVEVALELYDAQGVIARSTHGIARLADTTTLKEAPGTDNTLLPREVRTLTLPFPAASQPAAGARVVMNFSLWDTPVEGVELTRRVFAVEVGP